SSLSPDQQQHLADVASTLPQNSDASASIPTPRLLYDACYAKNQVVLDAVTPLLTARYPSNFFQAFTDGVVLLAVLAIVWLKPRRPGVILGTFLMTYGALRIVTEQFRTPDKDIMTFGGITLPMTLSGLMIVVGFAVATYAHRGPDAPLGGLLP